jgi:hypothetical protein
MTLLFLNRNEAATLTASEHPAIEKRLELSEKLRLALLSHDLLALIKQDLTHQRLVLAFVKFALEIE